MRAYPAYTIGTTGHLFQNRSPTRHL